MSRIGKLPIELPSGIEVKIDGQKVRVKGPKGELEETLHYTVSVAQEDNALSVKLKEDTKLNRKFHGLSRSLVANMVEGVSKGFSKTLTLIGTGYRAAASGKGLQLTLGYSHPIVYNPPAGIEFAVEKNTTVVVKGASKQVVGQVAADIRAFRPPEPYHGKGVRYADERIITKVGKSGGK